MAWDQREKYLAHIITHSESGPYKTTSCVQLLKAKSTNNIPCFPNYTSLRSISQFSQNMHTHQAETVQWKLKLALGFYHGTDQQMSIGLKNI